MNERVVKATIRTVVWGLAGMLIAIPVVFAFSILAAAVGAAAGFGVSLVFGEPIRAALAPLGLGAVPLWKLGAAAAWIGFVMLAPKTAQGEGFKEGLKR